MSGKVVKALYPFKGTNNDELSFRSGDKITLTQQDPEGWWEGTLNGKTGWFPCNYVEEITSDAEVSQVEPLPGLEATWATNRGEICKELIASEKKFIAELNKLRGEYLGPLRSTPLLTPSEFAQLSGNLDALIGLHTRLLDMALDTMASPPKDTRVGGGFLQLAPSLRTAYLEYCRRHPNAVALLDKYRQAL
ncbi:unnamed protein product [Cyprideis torosa]|uniref:Uncharacterized protein n=1 Tax=Cyprideis torosa TaxID=163714 RepID=A0A7R8WGF0_9CRUS|nr:unnamed protein product [Cyprideis torosa]CAG0898106.1 unnamed protein product [Cyprideis torosa]